MNSSFISTVVAILNDEDEIPGLPHEALIATNYPGEKLPTEAADSIVVKVARLQTLCFKTSIEGEISSPETLKQMAKLTYQDVRDVTANELGLQEDATRRIMMLERLIVEIVREAVPAEIEQLDVEYNVHRDGYIVRRPRENQRFLD